MACFGASIFWRASPDGTSRIIPFKWSSAALFAEDDVLGSLPFRRPTSLDLFTLTSLLRWVREDEQLSTVVLSIDNLDTGCARLQNMRRSIQALRQAGKYVLVYLAEGGTQEYYLASAANAVAMAPAGHLAVTGLAAETMFFKGALDKLGIEAQVSQAGAVKVGRGAIYADVAF